MDREPIAEKVSFLQQLVWLTEAQTIVSNDREKDRIASIRTLLKEILELEVRIKSMGYKL